MERKKILFVNSSLTGGGSERVMTLLANGFAEKEYDVTMVLLREGKKDTYQLDKRINCIRFQYGTQNKLIIAPKRILKLRRLMKMQKYDAVISFMYDINLTTMIASVGLKLKVLISERADPSKRKTSFIYKFIEEKMFGRAHRIVFQTENVKKMYPNKLRQLGEVIPNPINVNIPERYTGSREKTIVAAGRLRKQKNFSMLIRAFSKFYHVHPDYVLKIYGAGPLLEELQAEAAHCGVEKAVYFPGYVNDVNEKMRKAAIFVQSSDFEGISNSMLEALAMGVPTIATDCPVGGEKMFIETDKNGIIIPVNDEDALFNAMNKIASDPEYAEQMSREAVKINKRLSTDNIVQMWENII